MSSEDRYEWIPGARIKGAGEVPAAAVGELQQEYEAQGVTLEADDLVLESADPESPTHKLFEWDNEVAGQQWRVVQARKVLRNIRIIQPDGKIIQPAFVHVRVEKGDQVRHGYMSTLKALAGETTREYVLKDALRQLDGLRRRYEHLDELGHVWEAIDAGAKRPEPA